MMNKHKIFDNQMDMIRVVFFLLAVTVLTDGAQATAPQKTSIVEGNHYFSNYQINITYKIDKVNTQRPIIFILKKKQENSVFDNNLVVTLTSGSSSSNCSFNSFSGMCFLDNLPSSDMTMSLRCDHLPCEASWTILQPAMKNIQSGEQAVEDLYQVDGTSSHMMAMVTCNNPQITNFNSLVKAYSQNQFSRGYSHNIIYLLFQNSKKGHIYFKVDEKAKSCAHMIITNGTSVIKADTTHRDFIPTDSPNIYTFEERPTSQFRFDCSIHEIQQEAIKSTLIAKITGDKDGNRETFTTVQIKPPIPIESYEFNWAVPAIPEAFQNIQVELSSTSKAIVINFQLSKTDKIEVEDGEYSHFSFNPGENLRYRLIAEPNADPSEMLSVKTYPDTLYKPTIKSCSKKNGCEFFLTATPNNMMSTKSSTGTLFIAKNDATLETEELNFIEFQNKVTHKLRENQFLYFKRKIQKDKIIQVVINNPNAIIHAASKDVCAIPSDQCYEKIANIHNPFIYEPKKDAELLFVVEGLDNCEFTMTVIDEGTQEFALKDGEPFSYLMDDRETSLLFKFKISEKTAVNFNLIAPLNDLLLIVNNGKENPNGDEHTASTDGYISFTKSELQSKQFRIMVEKTDTSQKKFVHFTLIASTTGSNMRLDPGNPHYETLKRSEFKDYVFQFDKNEDYILNLYFHNLRQQEISIPLLASSKDEWTGSEVKHFTIDKTPDVLNLKDVSKEICQEEGQIQCQIFIRIANTMDFEIDLTLTLLVKDSVIQIKDGIWQTYSISTIAQTAHFFYLPKQKNSSISIMYKSNIVTMGIAYALWKFDQKGIDPTSWPFPPYQDEVQSLITSFSSINHVQIDSQSLKGCWPNCIVLLSLFKKKSLFPQPDFIFQNSQYMGDFSLLVANSFIELPQKTKIDVLLKQSEEKYLMVDLKYAMEKQALTFFTSSIIGSYQLYGNVYSEKNPRLPEEFDYDFSFGAVQTQIKISSIQERLQLNQMEDDTNIYLCILAKSYMETKFNIQFDSDEEIIKLLNYDSFEHVLLRPNEPKFFQLETSQKYEIKFTREKGFFYTKIAVCKNDDEHDYQTCLDDFKQEEDKGTKIVAKTEQFGEEPCSKCIVFIRMESDGNEAEGIIHVQSQYSMIELKEMDVVADFLNEQEENRYSITSMKNEETIISIQVSEGNPVVTVSDYGVLNVTKEKDPKTNNIHIVIPPVKEDRTDEQFGMTALGGVFYDAFRYSNTFRYLVVSVKSKNSQMPASYTISYSSGERETYLEDGLLTGYTLEPTKTVSFLYNNPQKLSGGFVTINMNSSASLYNLEFKMYTIEDPNDEDTKVEVTPQKPPMRKKTPNPTITYSLPNAPLVRIQVSSKKQQKISLIVNHQELIILPMDTEFPFSMTKGETTNMLAEVNNPGYLMLTIRKCDDTSPDFGYTFDRESFETSTFQSVTNMATEPKFQFIIKASKIGTLYMQMNSTDDNGLFSIKIHYSDAKIKPEKAKAGNNGVLEYNILDSTRAQIKFSGLVCQDARCPKQVQYYWLADTSLQDVYTQTVCPYSYFQILSIKSVQPLKMTQITATPDSDGKISFVYNYPEHITYLSVKAVMEDVEVYYQPIQVITVWGSLSKTGHLYSATLEGILIAVLVCCILVRVRRWRKKEGYQALDESTI